MELVRKHGVVLIDDEDAWVTHDYYVKAYIRSDGYRTVRVESKKDGRGTGLARVLLGITDPVLQADHINRDGFDNRRENLRVVSRDLQNANRLFDNPQGYKGVEYCSWAKTNTYRMQISRRGRKYHGIHRPSPELAALDYNRVAIAIWGHQVVINEVRCVSMEPKPTDKNCMFCNAPCHCCCVCFDDLTPSTQQLIDTLDAS